MEQLSATDALFAYMETNNTPMHIGNIAIYDPSTAPGGVVRFKEILNYLEGRLDGARLFRQKLVRVPLDLDHPYWVEDDDFDLEYHVRHIALPKPGDWRQLCIQAARIYARPLDMTKPLWEFTIIEGLDNVEGVPKGSFALLQKFHHAAVDGKSGLEMGLAIHDTNPEMKPRKFDRQWVPESKPNQLSLLAKTPISYLKNPLRSYEMVKSFVPGRIKMRKIRQQFEESDAQKEDAPKCLINKSTGPHRVFDGCKFPLAEIKKIRKSFPGATVNDVMLAVVSGGLRSYLMEKEDLPDKNLRFCVPISVRSDDAKDDAGNQVSLMTLPAGTLIDDAAERLGFIIGETQRSKAMSEALGAKTMMQISSAIPAGLMAAGTKVLSQMGVLGNMNPPMNTVITNVPGPMEKQYFTGAEMVDIYGLGVLADGQGIFHVVTSYNGNIVLTFLGDRNVMPDPDVYTAYLDNSYKDLVAAAKR